MRLRALAAATLLSACGGGGGAPECPYPGTGASWIAFSSTRGGNTDVWLVRGDGACLRRVTTDPAADQAPAWTPDGRLAFASARVSGPGIYLHDLASGAEAGISVADVVPASPSFAPSGLWLAFSARADGLRSDVYKVLATGGTPAPLTSAPGDSAGAVWSPDGATLYFASNRSGGYLLYSVSAAGGTASPLAGTAGVLGRPALSPDGTTLAYTRQGSGGLEVVAYPLPSGPPRVVTAQGDAEPAFDPAGTRLAVTSTRGGDTALWLVDLADGGHPTRLTTPGPGAGDGAPAFRP